MNKIVAFGNILLDTTVRLQNEDLLIKHNLEKDDHKEISQLEMDSLLDDIKGYEKHYTAGGCAQNTLRVIQWLSHKKCSTLIFGAVGSDERAHKLKTLLASDGVRTNYVENKGRQTGLVVALINGVYRTLVANLGATEILNVSQINKSRILEELKDADVIYIEGFFLTKREEAAKYALDSCRKLKKLVAYNLSGKYVCEEYPEIVQHFSENCDILFGNKREYEALRILKSLDSVDALYKVLKGTILVITDAAKTVICIDKDQTVLKIDVPSISHDEIADSTGAGDAFAAGFLFGYLRKKSLKTCAEIGCYASLEILRNVGVTLPKHSSKDW